MGMVDLFSIWKATKRFCSAHATEILIGGGIVGYAAYGVAMANAGAKTGVVISSKSKELERPLTRREKIELAWKFYVIPAIIYGASTGAIIGSSVLNRREKLTLIGAAAASESAYTALKDKLPDVVGPKKAEKVITETAQERAANRMPTSDDQIYLTGRGNSLMFELYTGIWFRSNTEELLRAQNVTNDKINREDYASLNDYHCEVGVEHSTVGDIMGWNKNYEGLVEVTWVGSSVPYVNGDGTEEPYLIVKFEPEPTMNFDMFS